jgi:hypothetical protein
MNEESLGTIDSFVRHRSAPDLSALFSCVRDPHSTTRFNRRGRGEKRRSSMPSRGQRSSSERPRGQLPEVLHHQASQLHLCDAKFLVGNLSLMVKAEQITDAQRVK